MSAYCLERKSFRGWRMVRMLTPIDGRIELGDNPSGKYRVVFSQDDWQIPQVIAQFVLRRTADCEAQ